MLILNSNHVQASVYVHYFKDLDAYRVGQIYDSKIAQQVSKAVFILKHEPAPPVLLASSHAQKVHRVPEEESTDMVPEQCPTQQIRKPRNAWIIFRQDMMIKFRDQIGHLHTSEQSKAISQMWKKTPEAIKKIYTRRSQDEKATLLSRFPNYRVRPRKSCEIKKRVKNKYPSDMTVDKLDQWILNGQFQVKTGSPDVPRKLSHNFENLLSCDGCVQTPSPKHP
ncbi:hypothetical protein K3495_g12258 [Podosphaera aphanis]|nr:hypothetical protein K3495_g12258 [Podosphaera aphanis]